LPAETPKVSVIVPAKDAAATIGKAVAALDAQEFDGAWEVVLVDDGSRDSTLERARAVGSPRLRTVRGEGRGAGAARNLGVAASKADLLAFTDADCAPTAGWLAAGVRALESADLVQGRVMPDPGSPLGPFDRTLWVEAERGFYETANLFMRRDLFEDLGGFEEWLRIGGRPFAEDLWLGWRAVRAGARTGFVPEALVHHAVFPRGPLGFVRERLRLANFPAVARRVPEFRRKTMFAGVFLSRRSAAFDAAAAGIVTAAVRRSPLPLAAAMPYFVMVCKWAQPSRKRAPFVAAVGVAADAIGVASLLRGSLRSRTLVL
jgi:glycosyltransferase involved in cell wall biosynthesis